MRLRTDAVLLSGLEYRFTYQHEESTHVIRARYVEMAVAAPPLYRGDDNPIWARMLVDPATVRIVFHKSSINRYMYLSFLLGQFISVYQSTTLFLV